MKRKITNKEQFLKALIAANGICSIVSEKYEPYTCKTCFYFRAHSKSQCRFNLPFEQAYELAKKDLKEIKEQKAKLKFIEEL